MYQKVTIVGNLGADPETRYLPNGDPVCNFSVAASERWKNKDGEVQERTEWFKCAAYAKLAEICGEYLKKGSLVLCEGTLRTRKYEDKEGTTRYSTEMQVNTMKMLGSKEHRNGDGDSKPAAKDKPAPKKQSAQDDFEDDIPF